MDPKLKARAFIARNLAGNRQSYYEKKSAHPLPVPPITEELPPDAGKLFQRFRIAISRWRAAGYPIVPFIILYSRWKICRQCEFWSGWRCKHPGCGCTGVKLGLATERCPIGKWEATVKEPNGK